MSESGTHKESQIYCTRRWFWAYIPLLAVWDSLSRERNDDLKLLFTLKRNDASFFFSFLFSFLLPPSLVTLLTRSFLLTQKVWIQLDSSLIISVSEATNLYLTWAPPSYFRFVYSLIGLFTRTHQTLRINNFLISSFTDNSSYNMESSESSSSFCF